MARNRKTLEQITAIEEPPVPDPARKEVADPKAKERRANAARGNDEAPNPDKLWTVASRDRWPDNTDKPADAAPVNDDGEEEEGTGGASLTKAQLQDALDDAGVEYPAGAKKADLVELYDANITE